MTETQKRALSHSSRSSRAELDILRARALRGDPLLEVAESRREWVWRSLLKGIRLTVARDLAGLSDEETEESLAAIQDTYRQRIVTFNRLRRE